MKKLITITHPNLTANYAVLTIIVLMCINTDIFAQTPPGHSDAVYNSTTGTYFKYLNGGGTWNEANTVATGLVTTGGWTSRLAVLSTPSLQSFARTLPGMGAWHIVWTSQCDVSNGYWLGGSGYGWYYCQSKSSGCGGYIAEFLPPSTNIWNGNTNSDWNTAANWSNNSVPTAGVEVEIPSIYTNPPTITSAISSPAVCSNLTLQSSAELFVDVGKGLSINGNLVNNGTIIIKSDLGGDASLILSGSLSGVGTFNVERYLSANQWHLVSSPITAGTAEFFEGIWLRPYLEATNTFGDYITPTETPLPIGQGFSVWTNSAEARTFTGTINYGNQGPFPASLTGSAGINTGWNLMGNPYTSSIDWNAASGWVKTNLANSVYVWNNNQYASYVGGVGTNGGSRFIASGQGFFVQAIASGASLSMNKNVQVHNGVSFLKNLSEPTDVIKVIVSANGYSDETAISIRYESSNYFDPAMDAVKIYGSSSAPQIYTIKNDLSQLSISSLNSPNDVIGKAIYIDYAQDGEHTISWSHTLQGTTIPVLYDNLTGIAIQPETHYTFTASSTDPAERFTFAEITLNIENQVAIINVWENDNILYIQNLTNSTVKNVIIYNMQGQLVMEFNSNVKDLSSLSPAVYVVRVNSGNEVKIEKIVIK
jgi:hypothetical protein